MFPSDVPLLSGPYPLDSTSWPSSYLLPLYPTLFPSSPSTHFNPPSKHIPSPCTPKGGELLPYFKKKPLFIPPLSLFTFFLTRRCGWACCASRITLFQVIVYFCYIIAVLIGKEWKIRGSPWRDMREKWEEEGEGTLFSLFLHINSLNLDHYRYFL